MRGEAYFDSENLFRGIEKKKSPPLMQYGVDHQLFKGQGPSEISAVRRTAKYIDVLTIWFRVRTEVSALEIHSYGKPHDGGYRTLKWALDKRRERYEREGVRYRLHPVGEGPNLAEQALVSDFRNRLRRDPTKTTFLVGGEDHDALYPVDHARLHDPGLDVWVLLPAQNAVWRRFRSQGSYPNLDPKKVFSLAEVLLSVWQDETQAIKQTRTRWKKRDALAIADARRAAGMGGQLSGTELERRRKLEASIARLIGIHEAGLNHAVPGSKEWIDAIGNDWAVEAAARHLPECASAAELAALTHGKVSGPRAAHLVRMSMVHHLLTQNQPETLQPLIFGLVRFTREYQVAAAAFAEVTYQLPRALLGEIG